MKILEFKKFVDGSKHTFITKKDSKKLFVFINVIEEDHLPFNFRDFEKRTQISGVRTDLDASFRTTKPHSRFTYHVLQYSINYQRI